MYSTWQLKPWFHTFLIHPHLFNVAIKVAYGSFDAASLNVSAVGSLPFPFPYLNHQPSPSAHIHLRRPSLLPQTQSTLWASREDAVQRPHLPAPTDRAGETVSGRRRRGEHASRVGVLTLEGCKGLCPVVPPCGLRPPPGGLAGDVPTGWSASKLLVSADRAHRHLHQQIWCILPPWQGVLVWMRIHRIHNPQHLHKLRLRLPHPRRYAHPPLLHRRGRDGEEHWRGGAVKMVVKARSRQLDLP